MRRLNAGIIPAGEALRTEGRPAGAGSIPALSANIIFMKLNQFTPASCPTNPRGYNKNAFLSITSRGVFVLSAALCVLLKAEEGDGIVISQDADEPENWFIAKGRQGFPLKRESNSSDNNRLKFSNIYLSNCMLKSLELQALFEGHKNKTIRLRINDAPSENDSMILYPIINTNPGA